MLEKYEPNVTAEQIVERIKKERSCSKTLALKIISKESPHEKDYQKKIIAGIKKAFPDGFVRKITIGQYSEGGLPDVMCIIKGHYFGFEVKRPVIGEATDLQKRTMKQIEEAGGTCRVVSYPEEAIETIRRYFNER